MLVSAVITVRPECEGQVPASLGRAIQSLFYEWLAKADKTLATNLHDSPQAKPFSVSNLAGVSRWGSRFQAEAPTRDEAAAPEEKEARPAYRPGRTDLLTVTPEQSYWFRLATYHPKLSKPLQEQILPNLPESLKLLDVPFKVESFTTDPDEHPWAGTDTFEAISMRQMLNPAPPRRFTFRFSSPTTFASSGRKLPVPMPELVFGSLLTRWNENAPLALETDTRRYLTECLYPASYRLATRLVNFEEFSEPGFLGLCEFQAMTNDRYWLGILASLAELAFYSGVGHRVTMGMGQARWLPPRQRSVGEPVAASTAAPRPRYNRNGQAKAD